MIYNINPLNNYIQSFVDYLKFQKRYSQHTIRSYSDDLLQFSDYLIATFGELKLKDISAVMIRSWLASVKEDGTSSRTINRKISTLKSFYKFQLKTGVLQTSPMGQINSPKISSRLPSFLKEAELATLFNHVEFPDDWKGRTDRLVLHLLYQSGLRLNELINLRESQVDQSKKQIKVLGKGNKERVIPMSDEIAIEIKKYADLKRTELEVSDPVFLLNTKKGQKLYGGYVYKAVNSYLSLITTTQKKSPHIMRHSFATHLMNNGADLNAVKELLGHSSLAATQVYTHNTIEKLKDVHKKSHPKA